MHRHASDFNCKTCSHRHCDENNPAGFLKWKIEGVIESKTCLLPMITPTSNALIKLFAHYDAGNLFTGGGVYDQPSFYLQAMEVIDHARKAD